MQITLENGQDLERRLKVSVSATEIDNATVNKLNEIKPKIKLDGFRPGKIPFEVVKQRFGSSVREEVITDFIQKTYTEALTQLSLNPAAAPNIELAHEKIHKFGEDLEYVATFEILPEIKTINWQDVTIEKLVTEVTAEDVERTIQKMRKTHAKWEEVSRGAQPGDQLVIDFDGEIKGETFSGGSAKNFKFELGTGKLLADFEEELKGAKTGEHLQFKMRFPKDYVEQTLAGKKAEFSVQVHQVSEPHLPEIDADFLFKLGIQDGGIEVLSANLREKMEDNLKTVLKQRFQNDLLTKLVQLNPITLPKVLVNKELEILRENARRTMARYLNKPLEEITAPPATEFIETAQQRVHLSLLFQVLAKLENIEIEEQRVRDKIEQFFKNTEHADEILRHLTQSKDERFFQEFRIAALEEQLLEYLQQKATIIEKRVGYDEAIS